MNKVKQIYLVHWLLSCFIVFFACVPIQNFTLSHSTGSSNQQTSKNGLLRLSATQRKARMEELKNSSQKKPLKLYLDSSLEKNTPTQKIQKLNLTDFISDSTTFSIQSLSEEQMVFNETFTKGRQDLEEIRTIQITNTDQRYTLHVRKNGDSRENGPIEVNINGNVWIKSSDFERKNREAENNTLLLNANNTLRVRLKGKAGASITVTLLKGGESGTVLRRQKNLRQPGETHATHVRENDTNIFYPNDISSLGQLKAFQSNNNTNQQKNQILAAEINGVRFEMEANTLLLSFENPSADLPFFLDRYDAKLLNELEINREEGEVWYYLQINPDSLPIEMAGEILQIYNAALGNLLDSISFSSVSSLKTFLILLDFVQSHPEKVRNFELNYASSELPLSPIKVRDFDDEFLTEQTRWWLKKPEIDSAWNYSLGTGVKVAYLDGGYPGLRANNNNIYPGQFPTRRFILDNLNSFEYLKDQNGNIIRRLDIEETYGKQDHAIQSMVRGFAEFDDKFGPPGVAPNATVFPYGGISSIVESVEALNHVYKNIIEPSRQNFKPDMVYFNNNILFDKSQILFKQFLLMGSNTYIPISNMAKELAPLGLIINLIVSKNIPFISASHNYTRAVCQGSQTIQEFLNPVKSASPSCSYYLPGSLTPEIPIIMVGSIDSVGLDNGLSIADNTNYGAEFLWSPQRTGGLSLSGKSQSIQGGEEGKKFELIGGTSAAGPFVGGAVALMLSRNPELTPLQIKRILLETGVSIKNQITTDFLNESKNNINRGSTKLFEDDYNRHGLKLFNARAAIEKVIKDKFGTLSAHEASLYIGVVKKETNNTLSLVANDGSKRSLIIGSSAQEEYLTPDKVARVLAWTGVKTGKTPLGNSLEVLKAYSDTPRPNFKNQGFKTAEDLGQVGIPEVNVIHTNPTSVFSGNHFEMVVEGKNLLGFLPSNNGPLVVKTHFSKVGTNPPERVTLLSETLPPPAGSADAKKFQAGTWFKMKVLQTSTQKLELGGSYRVLVEGPNGTSSLESPSFVVNNTAGNNVILVSNDIAPLRPYQLPGEIGVFLTRNSSGQRETVEPADVIGLAVKDTLDLGLIEVEIKDGNSSQIFNLQEVLHDATAGLKYGSFKIPEDMPTGVKDVIIRMAGTPGVTLEQAIEVLVPSRVNIRMSRNILRSDLIEEAEVYITVRNAQGQTVPDGSRFFVQGIANSVDYGRATYSFFDYSTNSYSYAGYYVGSTGAIFPVQNGRIRFRLGIHTFVNPLLLVDPWPVLTSPSFQLRVCNNFNGLSYACQGDLGPAGEAAGRFFIHHIDSINVSSKTPQAGGARYEMEVKDILGNPIPVGNVLTFENGGYAHCLIRSDGTVEGGYSRIPVTEPGKIIVTWSNDITCNRASYFNVLQGNRAGYYLKGSPVFLGP